MRVSIFASGAGTNFERLVQAAEKSEIPNCKVALLICDRVCPSMDRAERLGIPAQVIPPSNWRTPHEWAQALLSGVQARHIDLILLAGFLRKIEEPLLNAYKGRILNIHPALLPRHGGPGMYGMRVHQSVLKCGDTETGVSIHVVDQEYDHGQVIWQEKIHVEPRDTPESLATRVHELEYIAYPKAVTEYLKKMRSQV